MDPTGLTKARPTPPAEPTKPTHLDKANSCLSLTGMVVSMAEGITEDISASGAISSISANVSSESAAYSESMFTAEQKYYDKYVKGADSSHMQQGITEYQQAILPMQNGQQILAGVQQMWTNTMQSASSGMSTITQAITAALNNLFSGSQITVS